MKPKVWKGAQIIWMEKGPEADPDHPNSVMENPISIAKFQLTSSLPYM